MFKVGSYAEAIDDAISGQVIVVTKNCVTLKTADGFEMDFTPKQLVPLGNQLDLMKDSNTLYSTKNEGVSSNKKQNKPVKTKKNEFVLEVDLHIEKLVSSRKNLTNYDILNIMKNDDHIVLDNLQNPDNICEECKKDDQSVRSNLITIGYKICNSCRISKTIFPV